MVRYFVRIFCIFSILCSLPAAAQTKGKASYYAKKFHGRRMASGEIYHRDSMYCAHRTLPFGTKLRVRNLQNEKEVVVTVQDRGPHTRGRIIDLSYSAARELDMIGHGIVTVEVRPHNDLDIRIPFLPKDSIPHLDFGGQAKRNSFPKKGVIPTPKLRAKLTQLPKVVHLDSAARKKTHIPVKGKRSAHKEKRTSPSSPRKNSTK